MRPSILFVHLGPELPGWLAAALRQARLFNSCDILLIAAATALDGGGIAPEWGITRVPLEDLRLSDKHRVFRQLSPLDRSFRGGFWTFTSERFFVLESTIEQLALRNVVHLENDVMLYCSLDALMRPLSSLYRGLAATFDNDARCVPGILYCSGLPAISAVTAFYLEVFQQPGSRAEAAGLNDMQILGALRARGPQFIDHLPIIPPDYPAPLRSAVGHTPAQPDRYWCNFETLGLVFDAAALGQFLGGVDARNSPDPSVGFVNESCVFDPRLLRPRMIEDPDGRRIPVVATGSGMHRVANLHIHSKNTAAFLSVR